MELLQTIGGALQFCPNKLLRQIVCILLGRIYGFQLQGRRRIRGDKGGYALVRAPNVDFQSGSRIRRSDRPGDFDHRPVGFLDGI